MARGPDLCRQKLPRPVARKGRTVLGACLCKAAGAAGVEPGGARQSAAVAARVQVAEFAPMLTDFCTFRGRNPGPYLVPDSGPENGTAMLPRNKIYY